MVNKTISMSREMFDKISEEDNASQLIEALLKEHYKWKDAKKMTIEEIDKRIAVLDIQDEAKKKIEEIENV